MQLRPLLWLWVSLSQGKIKAHFPLQGAGRRCVTFFIKITTVARSKEALPKRGRCLISELPGEHAEAQLLLQARGPKTPEERLH